jgi:hypothetical protein
LGGDEGGHEGQEEGNHGRDDHSFFLIIFGLTVTL